MPRTAAPALVLALWLFVAAAVAAGCGEGAPSDEEAVRAKLTEFADATGAGRHDRLCDEVLAPRLVEEVERQTGRACAAALGEALGEVRDPQLTIGKVRVDGDRASAEVRTVAAGQPPSRDIVELVREREGWRVSSLSGPSPPSPSR